MNWDNVREFLNKGKGENYAYKWRVKQLHKIIDMLESWDVKAPDPEYLYLTGLHDMISSGAAFKAIRLGNRQALIDMFLSMEKMKSYEYYGYLRDLKNQIRRPQMVSFTSNNGLVSVTLTSEQFEKVRSLTPDFDYYENGSIERKNHAGRQRNRFKNMMKAFARLD